jgi:hypothetical protein
MTRLEQQLASLATRPAPTASRDTLDISGADNPTNFDAMAKQITENVLGVVQPVLQEFKQSKEDEQFFSQQQQAFHEAARNHPELRNTDSDLFKTFEQLWANPENRLGARSPLLVAEAAKGLMSDAQGAEQVRKMAAAVDTPKGPRQIDQIGNDGREIKEALDGLTDIGKKEGWNQDEFGDFLALKFKQHARGES